MEWLWRQTWSLAALIIEGSMAQLNLLVQKFNAFHMVIIRWDGYDILREPLKQDEFVFQGRHPTKRVVKADITVSHMELPYGRQLRWYSDAWPWEGENLIM